MLRCRGSSVVAQLGSRIMPMGPGALPAAPVRVPRVLTKRSFATIHSGTIKETNSFFAWYSRQLDERPILTKCVSAGLISCVGNVLAQVITFQQEISEENPTAATKKTWNDFQVDKAQVGRFAFLNVAFVAPVLHHWYNFINRALPGQSLSRVLQRTFWDEFVFSPVYIPVFLGGLWKLEGTEWPKIRSMLTSQVPGIIVAEWVLWVPTMFVTFRYAPVKFQVLVINVVGVAWQTFLSFMAAHAHGVEEEMPNQEEAVMEAAQPTTPVLYLESVNGRDAAHQGCVDHTFSGVIGSPPKVVGQPVVAAVSPRW
eukprot:Nitzschia sp. Nitz4//scaffold147_size54853//14501//15436//NITZ4_006611-RA/size54853-processed-gene-0.10-mRNA-1//1//CDS//3329536675//6207//frame0